MKTMLLVVHIFYLSVDRTPKNRAIGISPLPTLRNDKSQYTEQDYIRVYTILSYLCLSHLSKVARFYIFTNFSPASPSFFTFLLPASGIVRTSSIAECA